MQNMQNMHKQTGQAIQSQELHGGVELLSPAGDAEKLAMSIAYGANAVYLSGSEFGMRAAAGNFRAEEIGAAIEYCHTRGVKAYVTVNTVAHNDEIPRMESFVERIAAAGADAAILTDIGVFGMVKRLAPKLEIHISTQAGVANYAAARMWHELGAKRVILARELSIEEIAGIRANTPSDLDLECFVHGAMCVSFSGRCLLSEYMAGRDANRGACAQPCRWKYYLREEKREGEYFEVEEHPEGTYILNSKDLCAIRFLDKLSQAGIRSFKIEGRAKSEYYAAAVTYAYRGAMDDLQNGKPFDEKWYAEACKVSHREYCDGFFFGRPDTPIQHYADSMYIRGWDVAAIVESCDADGNALVRHKNRFKSGETLEVMIPRGESISFAMGELTDTVEDVVTDDAKHPHRLYRCRLPIVVPPLSILRKCKAQNL